MSGIRKQTIQSSIIVYIGFFVGALNMYFYTKSGSFTTDQFGLTRLFFDFAQNIFAFSTLGAVPVLYKFYPYFKDNLADKKNDLLTWVLLISIIGFIVLTLMGIAFEPYVVRKFSEKSKLFINYYHWVYPFSLGFLLFSVLESYTWALHKAVVTNTLKETVLRVLTTVFILLHTFNVITYSQFIYLFSFLYMIIAGLLVTYLWRINKLYITFSISRVTKKFFRKMIGLQFFVFGGVLLNAVAVTISGILIAARIGLGQAAVFTLAGYVASLIEIPQRSMTSVSTGVLSRAWKDKDFTTINKVYHRSSINMLLFAFLIFGNVWLNLSQGLILLHIQKEYMAGLGVVFLLGIAKIIDAGTGVNSVIISTSTLWKFEFYTNIVLLAIRIPIAYILIERYGILGPAYAELISQVVYNFIRYEFLRRKFGMQPFNMETIYTLILGTVAIVATYFLFSGIGGWPGIALRSLAFSSVFIGGIFLLKLTPDAMQLIDVAKTRIQDWKK
jgi:O-antigen/teichoic acid export membrane protein